jgi:16S rRNA (guanine527-N7)-methyltransferase
MHPDRIAELLEHFLRPTPDPCHSESGQRPGEEPASLSPAQLRDISTYIDLLRRWNARINLTAIRTEEEIVTRHFGESLFAARHLFPRVSPVSPVVKDFDLADDRRQLLACPEPGQGTNAAPPTTAHLGRRPTTVVRLADLGSGAGFPGIPIKLWAPQLHVTLIESNQKKVAFLREAARALTLPNIDIFPARAEHLLAQQQHPRPDEVAPLPNQLFDVVTLRAVERLTTSLPTAAHLLRPGGRLALLIGSSQRDGVLSTLPSLTWQPPLSLPQSTARVLLVGRLASPWRPQ